MEKVELFDPIPRSVSFDQSWAATGKTPDRERNIITSLYLDSQKLEQHNYDLQAKYKKMAENEVRYELIDCDDADYLFVAYGSSARICQKTIQLARAEGIKVGLVRPITLFPFPSAIINKLAGKVKGFLSVELSSGQMVEDVRLAVNGKIKVEHYGRPGGVIHSPAEVLEGLKLKMLK